MKLDGDWGRSKRYDREYRAKIADIKAHCLTYKDDATFAAKHGLSIYAVRNIRKGNRWRNLSHE